VAGLIMPIDHVTITVADLVRSAAFYDAALGALGLRRMVELGDEEEGDAAVEAIAWGEPEQGEPERGEPVRAAVWLVAGTRPTSGLHACLRARTRADVEAFHAAALAAGGRSHDAPRRWPIFRAGEFNAIVLDPDGNLIEAVAPE
jgi:catechol 2,3-dioxygenase-like lactoylglutathione lyase family enzyme